MPIPADPEEPTGPGAQSAVAGGVPDADGALADPAGTPADTGRNRSSRAWLREILLIAVFYFVYQFIRGLADLGARNRAFRHANWVVSAEKALHIFVEQPIQEALLPLGWLITIANTYYGSLHFVATGGILAWLFFFRHEHYRRARTILAVMTLTAMVSFIAFPLAPPRLLSCNDGIPAASPAGPTIGKCFEDTLHEAGGAFSYQSPVAKAVANPYAAMPSLHFGWSLWCALMLWWFSRNRVAKALGIAHAGMTLFVIVVTANHYLLDAVGGLAVAVFAIQVTGWWENRRSARRAASTQPAGDLVSA
ncbi:MAG: phosphatase PAP2 family protein [Acidimicrobiaceae bacterium]|nr:phosphatase PAP2 family protein [Ilumatobacter sp.]MCB9379986.1 phosphatase PAP2 family protein [Acidimicrobiaceae bacterium]MCO5330641.1 phosphatase PAP2 family protein [Ilumatobacteraceae bacterium]